MEQELWRKVEEVFHAALERTPDARKSFLDGICGVDNHRRRQVEWARSSAHRAAHSPMRTPRPSRPFRLTFILFTTTWSMRGVTDTQPRWCMAYRYSRSRLPGQ